MKTQIILVAFLTISAIAQEHPFVYRSEFRTNVTHVKAEGIIAAHSVTTVAQVAFVAIQIGNGLRQFEQPSIRLVSQITNLVNEAQVQKPLLSVQPKPLARPATKSEVKSASKPAPIPTTPTKSTVAPASKQGALYEPPQNVNADTNRPAYRRFHHLPPFDK